jgi:RHS repeat-associated protein
MSVNGGSSSTLTYDLNGNMTNDGTNSYSWDAENRMIKITYPGTNNFSSFVYDGLDRNVSIVETTAGSVTSTKMFVWSKNQRSESRDGSGTLLSQYFGRGQVNVSTKYFCGVDNLGSIREMTNNSGGIQGQYQFDPFGQTTKLSETVPSDFGYAGYYLHSRSGLNFTRTRAYQSTLARFINRDPQGEDGGSNLFAYARNYPTNAVDPSGLQVQHADPSASEVERRTGVTASAVNQYGCVAVVNAALHQPPGVSPEGQLPPGTKCWWGKLSDVGPAIDQAKKCSIQCPPGTHKVIWCKQGWIDQSARGAPGAPVADPTVGWDTRRQASGEWNYSVYDPATNTFSGADSAGASGAYVNPGAPGGSYPGENGSFCCVSCVKN